MASSKMNAFLVVLYTIDEKDDWTTEAALRKANPNYDVSVSGDYLRQQVREAIQSARKQNKVKTKHLNIWCNARNAWMNMEAWKACEDSSLSDQDFEGQRCFLAVDLSSEDRHHLQGQSVSTRHRRPRALLRLRPVLSPGGARGRSRSPALPGMAHNKLLNVTDGNVIDYGLVLDHIKEDGHRFEIAEISGDPWNATLHAGPAG
jgi:phage terminase large subunit-like protein